MTKAERFLMHIAKTRAKKVREPKPKPAPTWPSRRRRVIQVDDAALFARAIAAGMSPSAKRSKPL